VLDPLLSRRDTEATPSMMTVAAPITPIKRRCRSTPAPATGLLHRPVVAVSVSFWNDDGGRSTLYPSPIAMRSALHTFW
jgi:hypothetical protein